MKRVVCLILVLYGCRGTDTAPAPPSTVVDSELIHTLHFQSPDSTDSEGRRLAKLYCQSCHVFAEPELLDRRTLREWVLPTLAPILGLPQELAGLPPKKHQREGRAAGRLSARAVDSAGGLGPDCRILSTGRAGTAFVPRYADRDWPRLGAI